jgi:hypothetical protein
MVLGIILGGGFIIALLAVSLIIFAGYFQNPKSKIVGKWRAANGNGWSEYFSDGSVTVNDGMASLSGKYTFLEDGRLKIEMGALGMTSITTWNVAFDGYTVTFTGDDGHKEVYRRGPFTQEETSRALRIKN